MHICTITKAIVHLCTSLHPLIWVFFCSKCVESVTFFILQTIHADRDALMSRSNQSTEVFFYLLQFQLRPQICKYPNNKISN